MMSEGYGRLIILVTWALIIQRVFGSGTMEIRLQSYSSNGKDFWGSCCDSILSFACGDKCDPFFILCVDSYHGARNFESCSIYEKTTGIYDGQNNIEFENSIHGVSNPILIPMTTVPVAFNIKIAIYDHDNDNKHDHIDDLRKGVTNLRPSFNGTKDAYMDIKLKTSERATLNIKVRSYCDVFYFGDSCNKRCKDNEDGHYTCHNETGERIFRAERSCDDNLCKNGGSCHLNEMADFYCECQSPWKGKTCEVEDWQQGEDESWISSNWYVVVIPVVIALILVACLVACVVAVLIYRRRKDDTNEIYRCNSDGQPSQPQNLSYNNIVYDELNGQRDSDMLNEISVILPPRQNTYQPESQLHTTGACPGDDSHYSELQPVQYDNAVKQYPPAL